MTADQREAILCLRGTLNDARIQLINLAKTFDDENFESRKLLEGFRRILLEVDSQILISFKET